MTNSQLSYDYIVLGGGVAGLGFAHEATKSGSSVLILEKESEVGGLCRTLQWKDFKFDFSTHRFSGKSQHVLELIRGLLGDELLVHKTQQSRIFLQKQYFQYPFYIPQVIRSFKLHNQALIAASYLSARLKNLSLSQRSDNYQEWFSRRFGPRLYNVMCRPYTSKIWKCDPAQISADWAERRFPQEHLGQLFIKLLKNDLLKKSSADSEIAPDTGTFYYPRHGFQQIPLALAQDIEARGGIIHRNAALKEIKSENRNITYQYGNKMLNISAKKALISTIPLKTYMSLLPKVDKDVYAEANRLKYLDIILVFFLFNRPQITSDHWLYFADHDIIFNRAVEFKNWSKKMAPNNQTSLCVDITCLDGTYWNLSDSELKKRCLEGLEKTDLAKREDVSDTKVIRVPFAYPVYDVSYKNRLKTVIDYIEKDQGVFTLGRTGMFRYNNSHYSIEMGIELARRLNEGNFCSIHDYDLTNSV